MSDNQDPLAAVEEERDKARYQLGQFISQMAMALGLPATSAPEVVWNAAGQIAAGAVQAAAAARLARQSKFKAEDERDAARKERDEAIRNRNRLTDIVEARYAEADADDDITIRVALGQTAGDVMAAVVTGPKSQTRDLALTAAAAMEKWDTAVQEEKIKQLKAELRESRAELEQLKAAASTTPGPAEIELLEKDSARVRDLCKKGHAYHCAAGMVWGDGECTCPGDGTGSEHHTMNPPPGGWASTLERPGSRENPFTEIAQLPQPPIGSIFRDHFGRIWRKDRMVAGGDYAEAMRQQNSTSTDYYPGDFGYELIPNRT